MIISQSSQPMTMLTTSQQKQKNAKSYLKINPRLDKFTLFQTATRLQFYSMYFRFTRLFAWYMSLQLIKMSNAFLSTTTEGEKQHPLLNVVHDYVSLFFSWVYLNYLWSKLDQFCSLTDVPSPMVQKDRLPTFTLACTRELFLWTIQYHVIHGLRRFLN